ncbi:MAG TPA: histidine kinase [Verrucomicrobia bacterium]|nr:MAG: histidine kinase [Lentisphaerae bacterium GWF2_57_35]HBA85974.1 histidine kinase [Verrucomicrobiota bacterium]
MSTVGKLLSIKGVDVLTTHPEETVFAAIGRMAEKGAGSLMVVDAEGKLVGVVSERDCVRKVVLKEKNPKTTLVKEIMSTALTVVSPSTAIEECMALMTQKRIRHLPVLEKNQLMGVISIGDVVKFMVSEKDFIIKNLEQYIFGA